MSGESAHWALVVSWGLRERPLGAGVFSGASIFDTGGFGPTCKVAFTQGCRSSFSDKCTFILFATFSASRSLPAVGERQQATQAA